MEYGQQVVVLDASLPHSATQVSAGLINPFIGPKLNIPQDFSSCMEQNHIFFEKIEKQTGQSFLEAIKLYRVFQSVDQQKTWNKLPQNYRTGLLSQLECLELNIDASFGAGVTASWKLNAIKFIKYSREILSSQGNYFTVFFDPDQWKGHRVVFCDGFRAIQNNWFNDMPFTPAKGEVLEVESPYKLNTSNGKWHLTTNRKGCARIGSTWDHVEIESGPTNSAKEKILSELNFFPNLKNNKIISHKSGVRSATKDRQPILGAHPQIENCYIFNGFGSRGCTTISLCAKELSNFMLFGKKLPKQKDLQRFL